jgi:hypothetical protein
MTEEAAKQAAEPVPPSTPQHYLGRSRAAIAPSRNPRQSAQRIGIAVLLSSCTFALVPAALADGCPDATQDIVTDRPSVANSSVVVPTGSLQAENGINWTAGSGHGTLDGTNTRLRLGVVSCTEMLVDLPDYNLGLYGHAADGFTDVAPAIKHQFGGLPAGTTLSTIAGLALPSGARRISGGGYNPYIQFPWTQAIVEGWTAGGMLSTTWLTGQPASTTAFQATFLIDRQVGPHADVFAEYIANFETRGAPSDALNFGGSYRLTQTQQIDFHAGVGLNRNAPAYFVGIGYSLRFDHLW